MEETAQATLTISVRLTDDDFQLIQERCRAHGVSRSDYIRQLVHVRSRLDDVERGQEDIAARIDELCCLDAIRGR